MIFKQLSVQHFKRLKNATFDFKPGINIIKGENEAGKSTIKLVFLTALFAKPTQAVAEKIQTWGTEFNSKLTLKFTTQKGEGVLVKDFQEKEAVLLEEKSGRKFEDISTIQKVLTEIMGISSENLFKSTAYIDHAMVSDIHTGNKEISESLDQMFTGGGEDASAGKVLKKLRDIISKTEIGLKGRAKNPGPICRLTDEINVIEQNLSRLKTVVADQEKNSVIFNELLLALTKNQIEREEKQVLHQSIKRHFDLIDDESKLKKDYAEIEHKIRSINEDKEKLSAVDEKLKSLAPASGPASTWILLGLAGVASMILGLALYSLNPFFAVLLLISIPLFIFSLISFRRNQKVLRAKTVFTRLESERKGIETLIERNLNKKTIEQLQGEESEIRRKRKDIEDELSNPEMRTAASFTLQDLHRLDKRLKDLGALHEDLRDKKARTEVLLEQSKISESQLSEAEELLVEKIEELGMENKKLAIYKLVEITINEAFLKNISPKRDILKQKVSKYLSLITGGKYERVELDEGTLDFKVYSPEKNEFVSTDLKSDLSRGTIDQVFLAARLALVDVVSHGKKPPIFLDDPFVTFDEKRLARAMDLLKEISKEHQVFIFTCKDSYDRWADNLVNISLQ